MPVEQVQQSNHRSRRLPAGTWVGIAVTALMALLGLASSGLWGMVLMVAMVVLGTAVYGFAFRRTTWLRLPRKRSAAAIGAGIAFVVLIGSSSAYGAAHPQPAAPLVAAATTATTPHASTASPTRTSTPSPSPSPTLTSTPTPTAVITTKTVVETSAVPFSSRTVTDGTLAKGTTTVTTQGREGVTTKTWRITYTDGVESGRTLIGEQVTTAPVEQVTTIGSYVAPAPAPAPAALSCTNGTYVNSAGATVCRPEVADSAPSGATAKCGDGTYSFSQSRRGTCSHHGGVAVWL